MSAGSYTLDLLRDLVRINSINPAFGGGGTDEREIAEYLRKRMLELGMTVELLQSTPGRPSVVGVLKGHGDGRSMMLYGHHDTVDVEGMTDAFSADVRDGRMFGRGTYDMKGGVAACLGAIHYLLSREGRLGGDVLVASVADEENASLGILEVLRSYRPDAAIVTEPTELRIATAHKGFAWVEIVTHGMAAHGSRPHLGVDANLAMARVLTALGETGEALARRDPHPLLGPPSLHIGRVEGGTAPSMYAARATATVERRTIPGETPEQALDEVRDAVRRAGTPGVHQPDLQILLSRNPFEAPADSPLLSVLADCARARGIPPEPVGVSYWADAALLAQAGVDTVLLGPVGEGAHAAKEWVDTGSVETLALVLADAAEAYCGR